MPVSNATPLIYLARLGRLHLLKDIFGQVQVPPEVRVEVVNRGKERGYSDAYVIEEAFSGRWLITGILTEENLRRSKALMEIAGIDIGEAQVIILAKQKNERKVLVDQSNAREVARHLGLSPRGTIFIILTAIKRGLITKDDAKEMLANLLDVNFYLDPKIYRDVLKAIEKL